jgi:hypothetical protein
MSAADVARHCEEAQPTKQSRGEVQEDWIASLSAALRLAMTAAMINTDNGPA